MAERKTRTIEVLQHRGGGWDIRERGTVRILGFYDREVDAERKARELAKSTGDAEIIVRGESGRIYRHYTITQDAAQDAAQGAVREKGHRHGHS